MGFFSKTLGSIGDIFEEGASAVGDVVTDVIDPVLGPRGTRGATLGESLGGLFGVPELGARIGGAFSQDIAAAPGIYEQQELQRREQSRQEAERRNRQLTADDVSDAPINEQDYRNLQRGRQIYTAGLPSTVDQGTVIDIRYPRPKNAPGIVMGAGMDLIEEVGDFFFGDDNAPGMQLCKPAQAKAFSVNPNTGCITITRKQQAKLKELVRMVGIEQASKQIGLSVSMTSQLLLKTFRSRRRGISGADIRAVKRVDRQMHSLACALGGISQTSRAVAARKSPPKRSC
jgi:hypothetical protein